MSRQASQLSLVPVRACIAPVCHFKPEVEVVTHNREFKPCWENMNKLNLSGEQKNAIMQWIDAIHAQEAFYTVIAFRMGMQCCFSLLMQLADL